MPDERKTRRAVALRYEGGTAPEVVATGRALIAERILEEARRAGVPVREDAALTEALAGLELGREIGPELYAAVAETLAWAYSLGRLTRPR
jgi:flagellar biosynthesis protein